MRWRVGKRKRDDGAKGVVAGRKGRRGRNPTTM